MSFVNFKINPLFEKVESKNKLLRSVAGEGIEQIGQLKARWDKFELMMESHELMVKEQVLLISMLTNKGALVIMGNAVA